MKEDDLAAHIDHYSLFYKQFLQADLSTKG